MNSRHAWTISCELTNRPHPLRSLMIVPAFSDAAIMRIVRIVVRTYPMMSSGQRCYCGIAGG